MNRVLFSRFRFVLIAVGMLYTLTHAQSMLFVCIPGKQNTRQVQSEFDALIGTGKSLVFGRIKDLDAMVTTSSTTGHYNDWNYRI